jgi:hypothetical protein
MESRLAAIEKQYLDALEFFSNMTKTEVVQSPSAIIETHRRPILAYRTTSYANEAIKAALSFHRSIELLFEDIQKLGDTNTKRYIDRCRDKILSIEITIRGSPGFDGACSRVDQGKFDEAYTWLVRIRSNMYEVLEDVRLIYSLRLYPIEEKMALKSTLTDFGFIEVTKCLEEAEGNLAEKHNKECVDRCREALDKLSSSMLVYIGRKPSYHFAADTGTLAGLGVIEKETKKLTEATFSYLSEAGPHGRAGELNPQDAHWATKEVYNRIDVLMNKFAAYLKKQEKGKGQAS